MPLSLFVGVGVKGGGLALNRIGSWSSLKIAGEFQIFRYQLFVETSVIKGLIAIKARLSTYELYAI